MNCFRAVILSTTVCLVAVTAVAQEAGQEKDEKKWDITESLDPSSTISFETSEGTWMNVDVSPDGRTVVFDLLGDLYTMPIEGGKAKRLTHGAAFDIQPRFSPDGKLIAFISDRDGNNNIWVMDPEGDDPRSKQSGMGSRRAIHLRPQALRGATLAGRWRGVDVSREWWSRAPGDGAERLAERRG